MLSKHIEKVLQDVAERYGVTCIKIVLTDDDPIYSTIVPNIFPFAIHRICLWHILKKLSQKHLKNYTGNSKNFSKKYTYNKSCACKTIKRKQWKS
ncbi:hypothetical protein MSIBF_A2930010 [groundwater metagenome]|uniref:MULE transposase domain-containing protein n=1 Tax=groundwater metagenome TaxID=717931 RepID=A0A098EBN6_9ZZZZ